MNGSDSERLYYRAKEVAALLGLSLRTIYEGIYAGWIPSRKIGNSRLIPAAWLKVGSDTSQEWLAQSTNSPNNRYSLGTARRAA